MLPARLRYFVASEPANLVKLHEKGNKWIHEGEAYPAGFALRCAADDSASNKGPGRNDLHRGPLTSWLSKNDSISI